MARGMGGNTGEWAVPEGPAPPQWGRRGSGPRAAHPPRGLSFPGWCVLGALPYLVAVPSFVSPRVLSTFLVRKLKLREVI